MDDIKIKVCCRDCGFEGIFEDHKRPFACPKCKSENIEEEIIDLGEMEPIDYMD